MPFTWQSNVPSGDIIVESGGKYMDLTHDEYQNLLTRPKKMNIYRKKKATHLSIKNISRPLVVMEEFLTAVKYAVLYSIDYDVDYEFEILTSHIGSTSVTEMNFIITGVWDITDILINSRLKNIALKNNMITCNYLEKYPLPGYDVDGMVYIKS